ncbi:MAG: hypothetical protein PHG25_02255 [Candidatus Pacebacteria bacterium]|nr:hypothetical protein [Candidatus Paceibacterota bacterium]
MKKTALYLVALVVLVILLGVSMTFVGGRPPVHAVAASSCIVGETTCLSGWAWSSTIGWISFNSTDAGAGGGPYDVKMDASGNLSGYAWSSNIGWISFNSADLSVAPACLGTSPATVNTITGAVNGWARAVAGIGRNDGWDGCIELSNPSTHASPDTSGYNGTSTQGVTYAISGASLGLFSGYAWGGNVAGWIQFSPTAGNGGPNTVCVPSCPSTSNDLILQAQDYGAGSGGSGVWGPSVSFTLPQSGSITVPLRWQTGSATNVQTATADWGVSVGAITTLTGKALASDNTDSVTFSTTGTKNLNLSYKLSGVVKTKAVTVTVNPYVPPTNLCVQPAHTITPACGTTNAGPATVVNSCPTSASDCQFVCDIANGYKLKNGICAKSNIQEI